jgi:hypothetical protein
MFSALLQAAFKHSLKAAMRVTVDNAHQRSGIGSPHMLNTSDSTSASTLAAAQQQAAEPAVTRRREILYHLLSFMLAQQ